MRNVTFMLPALLAGCVQMLQAQPVPFADDALQRGYYDRPYQRYEAEPGRCRSNGTFLEATYDQTQLQCEATNQQALQLTGQGDYVEWDVDRAGRGLTVRFSLPDNAGGTGTKGTLALYADGTHVQDITLDSYWAWQYVLKQGDKYPDNTPADTKFPRMRFDEMHFLLPQDVEAGSTLRLIKTDDNTTAYTIDFVELEPVAEPLELTDIADGNKVAYTDPSVKLATFINEHAGQTIFLPAGRYEVDERIYLNTGGTKLIGAGMWHTEIYFSASSDVRSTHNKRGIETNADRIQIEGLYLNTVNNKRYYNNDSRFQVGKGFMGGFGSGSVIRNVWVEHFECGAWIADYAGQGADGLLVEHCRFRNNYADGINLCSGVKNGTVQHCSFRNNGDDDMASWSAEKMCENNTFCYNTAENNWRASSLGIFGGKQHRAHHCVIIDPMEAGLRVNCDFDGTGFSTDGYIVFSDISIYKGGVAAGTVGVGGDLWGNEQGSIHIDSSTFYDLANVRMENVDVVDSKHNALYIRSGSKQIKNLELRNIHIDGTGYNGIMYSGARGNACFSHITFDRIGADESNTAPSAFHITDCENMAVTVPEADMLQAYSTEGGIVLSGDTENPVRLLDAQGRERYVLAALSGDYKITDLETGIYLLQIYGSDEPSRKIAVTQ